MDSGAVNSSRFIVVLACVALLYILLFWAIQSSSTAMLGAMVGGLVLKWVLKVRGSRG